MGRQGTTAAVALLIATFSFACSKPKDDGGNNPPTDTATAAAPAPAPTDTGAAAKPTDAQIAHIAVTANTIDVEAGKDAKAKSKNADVKSFAQTMITDHSAVNEKASALAKKLNLTPEDNPTSQQMNSNAQTAKQQIDAKTGADFDKAYIDNEVSFHQQVLDALDNTLIPDAQNAELKSLLQQVRPTVAEHLQHAKDIQKKLSGGK